VECRAVEGGRSGRQERCPALVSAAEAHVAFSVLTCLSRFKREARSGPAHEPGHSREKRAPKKIGYCGRVEERAGDAADEQERERGAIERHPRDSIANQAPSKTGVLSGSCVAAERFSVRIFSECGGITIV